MEVVEKFIINRNNVRFIYAEKLFGNFSNIQFRIYYTKLKYKNLSPDDYFAIYGDDQKLSIYDFADYADIDLITNGDICFKGLVKDFTEIKNRMASLNKYNPSLWGYRDTLLTSIDTYNCIIDQKEKEEEFDYENEVQRLNENDIDDLMIRFKEYDKTA